MDDKEKETMKEKVDNSLNEYEPVDFSDTNADDLITDAPEEIKFDVSDEDTSSEDEVIDKETAENIKEIIEENNEKALDTDLDEETAENIKKIVEETNEDNKDDEDKEESLHEDEVQNVEDLKVEEDSGSFEEPTEDKKEDITSSKKFCNKCGALLNEDSKFCNKCGAAIGSDKEKTNEEVKNDKVLDDSSKDKNKPAEKKGNGKIIIICIFVLIVFIVLLIVVDVMNGNNTSKDNQETTIESIPVTTDISDVEKAELEEKLLTAPIFRGAYETKTTLDAYTGETVLARNMDSDVLIQFVILNPGNMKNYKDDTSITFEMEDTSAYDTTEFETIYKVEDFEKQIDNYFDVSTNFVKTPFPGGTAMLDQTKEYVGVIYNSGFTSDLQKVSKLESYDEVEDTYTVNETAVFVECVSDTTPTVEGTYECIVYDTSSKTNRIGSFEYEGYAQDVFTWDYLADKVDLTNAKTFVNVITNINGSYVWSSTSVK